MKRNDWLQEYHACNIYTYINYRKPHGFHWEKGTCWGKLRLSPQIENINNTNKLYKRVHTVCLLSTYNPRGTVLYLQYQYLIPIQTVSILYINNKYDYPIKIQSHWPQSKMLTSNGLPASLYQRSNASDPLPGAYWKWLHSWKNMKQIGSQQGIYWSFSQPWAKSPNVDWKVVRVPNKTWGFSSRLRIEQRHRVSHGWTSTGFPSEQQLSKSKPTLKPIPSCSPTASTFRNKPVPHTKTTHAQMYNWCSVQSRINVYTISYYLVSESVNIWYVEILRGLHAFKAPLGFRASADNTNPSVICIYLSNSCA